MHLLDRYKEAHFYTVMSLFNATEAQVHVYGQNTKPGENEEGNCTQAEIYFSAEVPKAVCSA